MNRARRIAPNFVQAWREADQIGAIDADGLVYAFPSDSMFKQDLKDQSVTIQVEIPDFRVRSMTAEFKAKRNRLLANTDWTQLPDVPEQIKTRWASYRQALRDLPLQSNNPLEWKWPDEPA